MTDPPLYYTCWESWCPRCGLIRAQTLARPSCFCPGCTGEIPWTAYGRAWAKAEPRLVCKTRDGVGGRTLTTHTFDLVMAQVNLEDWVVKMLEA